MLFQKQRELFACLHVCVFYLFAHFLESNSQDECKFVGGFCCSLAISVSHFCGQMISSFCIIIRTWNVGWQWLLPMAWNRAQVKSICNEIYYNGNLSKFPINLHCGTIFPRRKKNPKRITNKINKKAIVVVPLLFNGNINTTQLKIKITPPFLQPMKNSDKIWLYFLYIFLSGFSFWLNLNVNMLATAESDTRRIDLWLEDDD